MRDNNSPDDQGNHDMPAIIYVFIVAFIVCVYVGANESNLDDAVRDILHRHDSDDIDTADAHHEHCANVDYDWPNVNYEQRKFDVQFDRIVITKLHDIDAE